MKTLCYQKRKVKYTFWICKANSLVGDKHSTWVSLSWVSTDCNIAIENVAVLPVPDWACAMTSRPLIMGLIALCCIAEGRSKPKQTQL